MEAEPSTVGDVVLAALDDFLVPFRVDVLPLLPDLPAGGTAPLLPDLPDTGGTAPLLPDLPVGENDGASVGDKEGRSVG